MNQLDLFQTEKPPADAPKCITCHHWARVLTNYWGTCAEGKTWEKEEFSCPSHLSNKLEQSKGE